MHGARSQAKRNLLTTIMLHINSGEKCWRSKYPHAKILCIDTTKAEQLPGVEAVLTSKDIPGVKVFGIVVKNQAILAEDRVRYLGDGVAIVAAQTKRNR